jgi:hypothetical protein
MRVFRGPSTKDFGDDTHQLVEERDLSKDVKPWSDNYVFQANLTKEPLAERQAVAHVTLSEDDVIGIHRALMDEKLRQYKSARDRIKSLEGQLMQIRQALLPNTRSDAAKISAIRKALRLGRTGQPNTMD